MDISKNSNELSFLYSCCSGYNFYLPVNRRSYEAFGKKKTIIKHIKTEKEFYITELPDDLNNNFMLQSWVDLIRRPVKLKHYIWPVDLIKIPKQDETIKYALVFPLRELSAYESISKLLSDDKQAGWTKDWVRKIISQLLIAWCHFDRSKYAYHEFSIENMFFEKDNFNVMFDFSFSTHKADGLFSAKFVNKKRITPDYADSYYYNHGRQSQMDLASDYYSIAVILFKLLIGILPYQGRVMEHEPNSNAHEHDNWIHVYHNNPYFVFDEQDQTNHIGGDSGFARDQMFVDRWNELPVHVRNMFHNIFQAANVLRVADQLLFYSPQEWKDALFGEKSHIDLVYRNLSHPESNPKSVIEVQFESNDQVILLPDFKNLNKPAPAETSKVASHNTNIEKEIHEKIIENIEYFERIKEATYYDVILEKPPLSQKIHTIKVIRDITGLGLYEAKLLIQDAPAPIVQGVSEDLAIKLHNILAAENVAIRLSANTRHDDQAETLIRAFMRDHLGVPV